MMEENDRQWQCQVSSETYRMLKPDGPLFYNHKDRRYCKRDCPPEEFCSPK